MNRKVGAVGSIVVACVVLSFADPTAGRAATYSWANTGTNWNAASCWGGTEPGIADVVEFNSSTYTFQPVLTFVGSAAGIWDPGSGSVSIAGSQTFLLAGGTVNGNPSTGIEMDPGAGGLTIFPTISISNSQTWTNNSASLLNITGNVALNVNHVLTIGGSGNTLIGGIISGTGGLTKTGSGVLTLTASSAYSGLTSVNGGTLQIGNGTSISGIAPLSTINVASGATLLYATTTALPIPNNVSGGGTWGFTGSPSTANFTLSGTNGGFTGTLNVNSCRLTISGTSNGANFLPSSSATFVLGSSGEFDLTSGTCNSALLMSGFGHNGGGALALGTSVNSVAKYGGAITLTGNSEISVSGSGTVTGNISGPYQLTLQAAAGGAMTLTGTNTYGSTLISGTVTAGGPFALSSGALTVSSGMLRINGNSFSVAELSGSGQISNGLFVAVPATLTVGSDNTDTTFGGTLIDGGSVSLALTKVGTGMLTLTNASSFTGGTTISAGTLQLAGQLINSPVSIGSGVLGVNGNDIITSLSGTGGAVSIGGGVYLRVESLSGTTNTTFAGVINGSGNFILLTHGSLTLSGSGGNFSGIAENQGASSLILANSAGSALGTGTLMLLGGELATSVSGGSISGPVIAGNVGHTISPGGDGGIGTLGVGGLTINSLSTLRFDISSNSSFDQIYDSGSLGFSGTGAARLVVPNSVGAGLYPLITYSSTSSIGESNLSLGLIGGGTVPLNYELLMKPNELDLVIGGSSNNSILAASSSAVAFGRVMLNNVPSSNVAISLSSGTSQTGFNVSANGGILATPSGNGPGAIPPSGNVAISLPNVTSSYSGTVSVQNSGDDGTGPGSAGAGLGFAQNPIDIGVTGTVVDNRVVTSTSAAFALIHLGQSVVSQSITLSTTGSDSQYTRVTVPGGSDANGLSVSGGASPTFNSPTVTDSRTLGGTPNAAGIISGTVVLATSGEGLAGESPINVSVNYTVPVFSGSARWNGSAGGSWGTAGNWNDTLTPSIQAAPGTFAGYADAATLDNSTTARAITLDGASPHISSLTLSTSAGSGYSIAQGTGGTLHFDNGAGTANVTVTSGTHSISAPITLDSATNIASNGGTLLLNTTLSGSGSLLTSGGGTLTLPGADTYSVSGGIIVNQGTLAAPYGISHAGGGVIVVAGATLSAGGQIKRAISGEGTVTATDDVLIGSSTQVGQFNQGGAPGEGGTLNVGGNAVAIFSTDAAVLGSQTNIGPGGSLTTLNGARLGNASSVDATKVLTASGSATINGNFVNNGTVNGPTGAGQQLIFTQFVKGAGSTTGNVEYQGAYSPGNSPDIVSVQNVTFTPTSTLILELAASGSNDELDISGNVALNGTLNVLYLNGYTPAAGDSFELFDGSTSGTFGQINLPALGSGLSWDTSNLYSAGTLDVVAVPEPATAVLAAAVGIIVWLRRRVGQDRPDRGASAGPP